MLLFQVGEDWLGQSILSHVLVQVLTDIGFPTKCICHVFVNVESLTIAANVATRRADPITIISDVTWWRRFRHWECCVFRHLARCAWLIQAWKLREGGRNLSLIIFGHEYRWQHRLVNLKEKVNVEKLFCSYIPWCSDTGSRRLLLAEDGRQIHLQNSNSHSS